MAYRHKIDDNKTDDRFSNCNNITGIYKGHLRRVEYIFTLSYLLLLKHLLFKIYKF